MRVELIAVLRVERVLVAVKATAVVALVADARGDSKILPVFVDMSESVEDVEIVLGKLAESYAV